MATDITITAMKVVYLNRRSMRPLQDRTDYKCTGPDGTVYKNTNLGTLKQLLRQRYGKINVTIRNIAA